MNNQQDVNKLLADSNNPLTENLLDILMIAYLAKTDEIEEWESTLKKNPNNDAIKEMISNHLKDLKNIGDTWEILNLNGGFSFNDKISEFINSLPTEVQVLVA